MRAFLFGEPLMKHVTSPLYAIHHPATNRWSVNDARANPVAMISISEYAEGTAHLMATAPDMKATLLAFIEAYQFAGGQGMILPAGMHHAYVKARRLMRRIEGENGPPK